MDAIIDEWPTEWKFPICVEELAYAETGLPPDILMEQDKKKEYEEESHKESLANMSDS